MFFFVKWGIFSLCVCHRAFSGKLGLNFKIPRVKLWFALAVSLNFSSPRANTSYGIDKLFFCFHFFISVSVGDICRYSMYKPWWKFKRRNNRCTLCCLAKQWVKNCIRQEEYFALKLKCWMFWNSRAKKSDESKWLLIVWKIGLILANCFHTFAGT